MWSQTVPIAEPARLAAASRARVFGGVRAGRSGSAMRCQPRDARRCSRSSWPVRGSSSRDVHVVPLHVDAAADPARRRRVVGRGDLDTAVEVHGAAAVLVVAERLDRQRAERRAFLGKHGGDLALGRAVDAGVGPALLPAVEVGLGIVELLEAEAAQRGLLRVADSGLDLALSVGVADAARQGDDAVVGEHVAVERIERRVVDVRMEDALFEIVEHDDTYSAAQPPERPLVELGPDLCAGAADQQPHGFCASSRASGRRAVSAGTCRSPGRGPSVRPRNQLVPLHRDPW